MVLAFCAAILGGSCKWFQGKNANSNTNVAPKLARWVQQYRSPLSQGLSGNDLAESFYYSSISVLSSSAVYVAGDMRNPKNKEEDRVGVFLKTADGGQTWNETIVEQHGVANIRINGMSFPSPDTGYLVGRAQGDPSIIFKTTDGGKTWAFSRVPEFKQAAICIYMVDAENGWMGGSSSIEKDDEEGEPGGPSDLLATTDGGKTWQSQARVPVSIYAIKFLDKTTGWASGSKGAIYRTVDGGRTWDKQKTELEPGDTITLPGSEGAKMFQVYDVSFLDAEHGYAGAGGAEEDAGRVLFTSNGGGTWAKQRMFPDSGVRDVLFVSINEGWIVTDKGNYIYHTVDGNKTLLSEQKAFEYNAQLAKLGAADAQHVWAVGGGAIFVRQVD